MKYFNRVTKGKGKNCVIMGRTTWDSLPPQHKPLKDRVNVVISRNSNLPLPPGVNLAGTFEEALYIADSFGFEDGQKVEQVFIIGGEQVYKAAIADPSCEKIYLTELEGDFSCDTFFPRFDMKKFKKAFASETHEENGVKFSFAVYAP